MSNNDIIEQISKSLLDVETVGERFLPLQATLNPVKEDLVSILSNFRTNIENSEYLSDRLYYMDKYIDLVKKVDSIFDAKSKRLQLALQAILKAEIEKSKMSSGSENSNDSDNIDEAPEDMLAPEQVNEILKILNGNNKE